MVDGRLPKGLQHIARRLILLLALIAFLMITLDVVRTRLNLQYELATGEDVLQKKLQPRAAAAAQAIPPHLATLPPWSTTLDARWWQNASSSSNNNAGIKNDTIVYLVQGPGSVPQRWLEKSTWDKVSLIFLSWNQSDTVASPLQQQQFRDCKFRMFHSPCTTWTTGRNQLLKALILLEREQGWEFEYMVFFDEDVRLVHVPADRTCKHLKNGSCEDRAFGWFNTVLLRDRPLQAAVSYETVPPKKPNDGTQCIQRCHVDHLVMAYHRTAAAFLLPYDPILDSDAWWSSAYIQNLCMSALAPRFCNYYYELTVDVSLQTHGAYPRGNDDPFDRPRALVGGRLARAQVPGFREGLRGHEVMGKLWGELNPDSTWRGPCVRSAAGVDFGRILSGQVPKLLKCH